MTARLASRSAAGRFDIRQNHEMNVTPFVDVLLVLLIVFIIAAPLATTAIQVDIAAGDGGGDLRTPVSVMIDDRGAVSLRLAWNRSVPTSLGRLGRDLGRAIGAGGAVHSLIVVSGSAHTRYGAFMAVMDRLHADGFTHVTLAAKSA